MIELSKIRIDGGTQAREKISTDIVAQYAEDIGAGADFPAVELFYDGKDYWLADGFHRYFAAKRAGARTILEHVTPGTMRDAILFSLGANGKHGLPPSNADKRKAIDTMLGDPEWSKWSDTAIAKACFVTHKTVSARRASILGNSQDSAVRGNSEDKPATRTVTRNGKTYEQATSNIGKSSPSTQWSKTPAANDHQAKVETASLAPAVSPVLAVVKPEYSRLDALQDQIEELQAELAIANMGDLDPEDKDQAKNLIEAQAAEIKTLRVMNAALTVSRDLFQSKCAEMQKQINRQRREIDKVTGKRTA